MTDSFLYNNSFTTTDMEKRVLELYKGKVLKHRTIKSMAWMIKCMKWKYRQGKNIPDDVDDCNVEYSTELKEAINVLKELCDE